MGEIKKELILIPKAENYIQYMLELIIGAVKKGKFLTRLKSFLFLQPHLNIIKQTKFHKHIDKTEVHIYNITNEQ